MQPHTSAGRVPTIKGYRFFVDTIVRLAPPKGPELIELQRGLTQSGGDPQSLALSTSNLLSTVTHLAGVVTVPRRSHSELQQIEFVPLSERPVEEPLSANHFVLDSPEQSVVGVPQVVYTSETDTLADLARTYGLGYDELLAANPDVNPWLPGENTPVLLPTQFVLPDVPRDGIVLNMASKRLFYFPAVGEGEPVLVKTFPIGIGRVGWETPLGATTVIDKARDPHWYVPWSVRQEHAEMGDPLPSVVPPGPDNPLGHRVLKLDMPGYLIHGTNQPWSIGKAVSSGCIRMRNEDVIDLYERVKVGARVVVS